MEPACWGIKFKPIIRKVHTEDSKYYFEIIPEVSSLKNFDKIEWNHENVFYEYTIPMAYKLIVKRDPENDQRDSIDSLDPMYHSCVDLYHSSLSSTCWASGDVNRILSDSFVFSNLNTNLDPCCCTLKDRKPRSMQTVEKRDNFMLTQNKNETCTATKSTALIEETPEMTATETQMNCYHDLIDNMVQNFVEEECLFLVAPKHAQVNSGHELNNMEQNSVEKGTHISQCALSSNSIGLSDINFDLSDDVVNVEQEIVPEIKPCDYMQKLSLSPICSIIVNTEPVVTKLPLENVNTSLISDYDPNNIDNQQNNRWFKDGTRDIIITAKFKNSEYVQSGSNLDDEPLLRIAPEIRIQYYMNMLRKEVLPLNNMLDDILRKYAALNVRENDFVNTVNGKDVPKTVKMLGDKEVPEEKCIKSNRVVYTIVFDG